MAMAQVQRQGDSFGQRAMSWPARFKNYVEDLQLEMRRVTWPTWKQVRATTLIVLIAVFAFAGYFLVVDFVVGRAITKIFDSLTR
jgi:preprotein translocase subunit SecE